MKPGCFAFRGLCTEQAPPSSRDFVKQHVDMQFADVHALLRLPITTDEGLEAGCNLAARVHVVRIDRGCVDGLLPPRRIKWRAVSGGPQGVLPVGPTAERRRVSGGDRHGSLGRLSQSARTRMGRVDQGGRAEG